MICCCVAVFNMISSGKVAAHVAIDMIRKHGSKAAEKLREAFDRTGGAKVTKKHVSDRVPPKVAIAYRNAASSLKQFFDEMPKERDALASGQTVMVPGKLLAELLAAHEQLQNN